MFQQPKLTAKAEQQRALPPRLIKCMYIYNYNRSKRPGHALSSPRIPQRWIQTQARCWGNKSWSKAKLWLESLRQRGEQSPPGPPRAGGSEEEASRHHHRQQPKAAAQRRSAKSLQMQPFAEQSNVLLDLRSVGNTSMLLKASMLHLASHTHCHVGRCSLFT